MDMRQHLPTWIHHRSLHDLEGRFEGEILDVGEELVQNRFKGRKQLEPVSRFSDGWRVVPNISMRAALIEMFGAEWKGRRIAIDEQTIRRTDPKTGEILHERVEKRVCELEGDVETCGKRRAR